MISFQQLKYFVTTIDSGSLNKASKILYVSQPALTKQISQLEQELQVTLLRRKPTGIELTEAGDFFYQKAVSILNQVQQLLEGVQTFTQNSPLRIGALPSLSSYFLPPYIGRWNQLQLVKPSITVRDTTQELTHMVEEGELDFAVVQDYQETGRLSNLHLKDEPYDAVIPVGKPLSKKSVITLQEFAEEPLVLHKYPCDIRVSFQKLCRETGIQLTSVIDLEFNESIIPYVSNGLGISIVPRMVSDHIYDPHVVIKLLEPAPTRTIQAVYLPKNDKWVKDLFDFVT